LDLVKYLYNPLASASVNHMAAIHDLGLCRWKEAEDKAKEASELCKSLKDWRGWEASTITLAYLNLVKGEMTTAASMFVSVKQSAIRRCDKQMILWSLLGIVEILTLQLDVPDHNFLEVTQQVYDTITNNLQDIDMTSKHVGFMVMHKRSLTLGNLDPDEFKKSIKEVLAVEHPPFSFYLAIVLTCDVSFIHLYIYI
jgi:hypothetical protein